MKRVILPLLALLIAAAAPAGAQGGSDDTQVPAGIRELVADRGRAFVDSDRDLLSRTLHGGRFAELQLAAFDAARQVPLSRYDLRVSTQFGGDFASRRVRDRYPGMEVAAFHVVEEQMIDGFETQSYVEHGFYTFVRDPETSSRLYDGWRHASLSDFDELGVFSARRLWDGGPVQTVSSEHFLVMAHPPDIERARSVLPLAERAYEDVREFWPEPLTERYVIVIPSSRDELQEMLQTTLDLSNFVAFAAGTVRRDTGYEPAGVRLILQMSHYERYQDEGRREILAHELLHAVTRPVTGPFIPIWVEEGLAMLGSEGEQGLDVARAAGPPDEFPPDDDFLIGPVSDIVLRYRQSQAAVAALVDHFGTDGLARFYTELGSARVAPGTASYHVEQAASRALGWTADEWVNAWHARLQ